MITVNSNVEFYKNERKYKKARSGAHLVGTEPSKADLWLSEFKPMIVVSDEPYLGIVPSTGEYRMFGFKMGDQTWYQKVWVCEGKYYIFTTNITIKKVD